MNDFEESPEEDRQDILTMNDKTSARLAATSETDEKHATRTLLELVRIAYALSHEEREQALVILQAMERQQAPPPED